MCKTEDRNGKRNALMSYNLVKHHAIKEKINFAYIQILINDFRDHIKSPK